MMTPSFDNVILKVDSSNEPVQRGLITPFANGQYKYYATVIRFGPGLKSDNMDIQFPFNEGDKVFFNGNGLECIDGDQHLMMAKFLDVLAKVG